MIKMKPQHGAQGHFVGPNHFVETIAPPERGRMSAVHITVVVILMAVVVAIFVAWFRG